MHTDSNCTTIFFLDISKFRLRYRIVNGNACVARALSYLKGMPKISDASREKSKNFESCWQIPRHILAFFFCSNNRYHWNFDVIVMLLSYFLTQHLKTAYYAVYFTVSVSESLISVVVRALSAHLSTTYLEHFLTNIFLPGLLKTRRKNINIQSTKFNMIYFWTCHICWSAGRQDNRKAPWFKGAYTMTETLCILDKIYCQARLDFLSHRFGDTSISLTLAQQKKDVHLYL